MFGKELDTVLTDYRVAMLDGVVATINGKVILIDSNFHHNLSEVTLIPVVVLNHKTYHDQDSEYNRNVQAVQA